MLANARERSRRIAAVARAVAEFQNSVHVIDEAAARRLGLNATDLRCLGLIADQGPVSAGALARGADLTPGATTTAIDRLERGGHVRRAPNPRDRRGVLVEATPKARRLIREIYGPVGKAGVRSLARYSDTELALLGDFLRVGRELQFEYARRIAGSGSRAGVDRESSRAR